MVEQRAVDRRGAAQDLRLNGRRSRCRRMDEGGSLVFVGYVLFAVGRFKS